MVKCLGGETENIRTIEKALQVFRNEKIFSLMCTKVIKIPFTSSDKITTRTTMYQKANSNNNDEFKSLCKADNNKSSKDLSNIDSSVTFDFNMLQYILSRIILVLYRGGKKSWNPTVNKWTVLVLQKFQV